MSALCESCGYHLVLRDEYYDIEDVDEWDRHSWICPQCEEEYDDYYRDDYWEEEEW